ncbi:hypothetical protein [Paractinoplanes hotanensis]|uniref:Uncharacterized protein n=1 Tax=Paractinoplanes hotanensis TaxID=2906497 RepID=A0ABT0XVU3_9ACTN|nr:hypothetical protein [Actinoplanes hotanensis]MCM4077916.1 hypothetical protein [Actinoplanes hotanensis]
MTPTAELERLVRPSDVRGRHGRHGRRNRRRGRFGTIADAVVAAINAFFV